MTKEDTSTDPGDSPDSLKRHTFPRTERLKSRGHLTRLYEEGSRISQGTLSILYLTVPIEENGGCALKVTFGASKRNFRLSPERNRVKRVMREAYRMEKHNLLSYLKQKQTGLVCMINCRSKRIPTFQQVREDLQRAFDALIEAI